jgi:hypothetical protein
MGRWTMTRNSLCLALALGLTAPNAHAAEPAPSSPSTPIPSARYTLKQARIDATETSTSRYTINARFAPVESAGELREVATFSLIGRFAKGGSSCSIDGTIFRNGFEGNP